MIKIKHRNILVAIIILLYAGWTVIPVSAHALLLRSNPAANAVLDQPPIQVELFFSETLESKLSSITVIDSNGVTVDVGDSRVDPSDPTRVTVSLHTLTNGVYTVSWKALSTVDGHLTVGSFPFAVGSDNAQAVQSIRQSTTIRLPFAALLAKFLFLASLALLAGRPLFILLVWSAVTYDGATSRPSFWKKLYRMGLIGAMLAIGLGVLSQAGQTIGSELIAPWNPQFGQVLFETRLGLLWLVRLVLVMAALWLAEDDSSVLKTWGGLIVSLGLLLSVTLTSHAATEARPLIPILGDWLHLIGMGFWFGGVAYLGVALYWLRTQEGVLSTKVTSLLASRFSVNAQVFVGLIGVTGFCSAYLRLGSWSALFSSLYGQALLIKQVFVGGLLLIAAINMLIITPRLKRSRVAQTADANVVRRFAKNVTGEVVLAVLVLGSVSYLSYVPPAQTVSRNTDLAARETVDDLRMNISISPGQIGQNTFSLDVTVDGKPLQSAKNVLLRFTPANGNLPPSELQLLGDGNGTFSAKGANLSLPGKWQVQAVIRRTDKFDAYAHFDFNLRGANAAETPVNLSREAGTLLVLLGILCVLLMTSASIARPAWRWGVGIPVSLVLVAFGVIYLARPAATTDTGQANPIPPNQASIEAGRALFTTNCMPCHGATGKGDGPVGLTLNPPPADLTLHTQPGVHPDSQLFDWVTNGFPGSQMPAFKTVLSDTDRWNLVNYIRTLALK